MKKICVLTIGLFLLVGVGNAFAVIPDEITDVNVLEDTGFIEETWYEGKVMAGGRTETTTTTTVTSTDEADVISVKVDVTVQTTISAIRGGTVKVISMIGNTIGYDAGDGSTSGTDFGYIAEFDDQGRLTGAHGALEGGHFSISSGSRGFDGGGDALGTFESKGDQVWEVRNGQLLVMESVSKGTTELDGEITGYTENGTVNVYEQRGGEWVIMSSTSTADSTGAGAREGESSHIVTTLFYDRNGENPATLTGLRKTKTGTMVKGNATDGFTTYQIKAFSFETDRKGNLGIYIKYEKVEWEQVGDTYYPQGPPPAVNTAFDLNGDGVVNQADVDLYKDDNVFGTSVGDDPNKVKFDINGDGWIDFGDVLLFGSPAAGFVQ